MNPDFTISKLEARRLGRSARRELLDRAQKSLQISQRIQSLSKYRSAKSVCCYVHSRNEVQTLDLIRQRLQLRLSTFVPYCDGDQLRLFRLQEIQQLATGRFGILEPLASLRTDSPVVDVNDIDLFLIPGVAFDQNCHRIGQGAGFYDRLLSELDGKTFVGLGFDCQIFPRISVEKHDISMNLIVTESQVIGQSGFTNDEFKNVRP